MEFLKNKIKAMRTFATETALSSAVGAYDGEVVSVSVTGNVYVWKSATGTWEIQVKRNTDGSYVLPSGSVSAAGAWTFGVVDGTAAHIFNGNLLQIRRSDNSKLRFTPSGSTSYFDSLGVNNITNGAYGFRSARSDDSNFITLGTVSGTGIWSLGQVSSPNYNNVCHVINGGLKGGGSTGSSGSARFYIGTNFNAFGSTATSRTNATFSGGGISFDNAGAGNGVIAFYANQAGDALATDADIVGAVTDAGAWMLGTSTTTSVVTIAGEGNCSGTNFKLGIRGASDTAAKCASIQLGDNSSGLSRQWAITNGWRNSQNVGDLCFLSANAVNTDALNGSGVVAGFVSSAGAWTLGPSAAGSSTIHIINGYNSSTGGGSGFQVKNLATNTGSAAAEFTKASSDTTTSHRLVVFTVNGGSSGSGQINANGSGACAFGTFSDYRLKENIVPLAGELEKILSLNPVEFDYKSGGHQIGFIAQEMREVYPDSVGEEDTEEKLLTITGWDKTAARLVKAIQELNAKVESLQSEIALLKGA